MGIRTWKFDWRVAVGLVMVLVVLYGVAITLVDESKPRAVLPYYPTPFPMTATLMPPTATATKTATPTSTPSPTPKPTYTPIPTPTPYPTPNVGAVQAFRKWGVIAFPEGHEVSFRNERAQTIVLRRLYNGDPDSGKVTVITNVQLCNSDYGNFRNYGWCNENQKFLLNDKESGLIVSDNSLLVENLGFSVDISDTGMGLLLFDPARWQWEQMHRIPSNKDKDQ